METVPGSAESFPPPPPPPPPQRSRKGLWIGLGIAAVVLCICLVAVAVGGYLFRQNISNYFYTRTAQLYSNPDAGLSLYYPQAWQYNESGDATSGYQIILASSPDFLNDPSTLPQTGAIMLIMTNNNASDLSFTVDASSMGAVVDNIATNLFSGLSPVQNPHTFTLSGYPAASGVYAGALDTTVGDQSSIYIITVLRKTEIIIFLGVCPQTEWAKHQPTFDSILNSVSLVTP